MKARTNERDSPRKLKARVLQSPEPPQVPRAEWDFRSCPNDELFECRAYEYARETPAIVEDVRSLRKRVTPLFEELVKALRDRIDQTARVMGLFWYCPEFPDTPYLTIPSNERRRRIDALWPPANSSIAIIPKLPPPDIGQKLARGRVFQGSSELALFETDWTRPTLI
jgi:hypothetical protein